jgi:hypothetical protein
VKQTLSNLWDNVMSGIFNHLGLIRWPFTTVPDPQYSTFIADRAQLQTDISALLTSLSRRDVSSIHLFWAWFGAGKTHTLYYLANRAAQITEQPLSNALHTVYTEFPKSARGFMDLYRSFAAGLDMDVLIDAYLEVRTCPHSDRFQRELMLSSPDLFNALQVLAMGEQQDQITALRWLRGEALPVAQLRTVGISQKISTAENTVRTLTTLVNMFGDAARAQGRPGSLVLWMLDEFQRITRTGARVLDEINTGLHSTFNACPNGLSLFLSFSGKPQRNLPAWFSRELRDRIGRTRVMILPPMLPNEALTFVRDVLAQFRPSEFSHPLPYFPFGEDACKAIIEEVDRQSEIKPRAIMQAFSAVLEEADPKIEAKEFDIISPEFAKRALAERIVFEEGEED